ncbi:phage baseplate assembly protein V [Aquabacterium sp.]|uniref:phage baseplate assembly protein V n=1 Tax=Aquabacterium sp. TaxID=1872578 RepID=UPI003BB09848
MDGFALAELDRRFANVITLGSVHSVDAAKARLRVSIGDLVSDWLPWLTARAGDARTWWCPSIGEQCVVLAPSGDLSQGVVLVGMYQSAHPAPSNSPSIHLCQYADGTRLEYDASGGVLSVDCVGDVLVKGARTLRVEFGGDITLQSPHITLDAPTVDCTGALNVAQVTTTGGLASTGAAGGASINGGLQVNGGLTDNGVNVGSSHTHGGVDPGSGSSGGPK